MILDLIGEAIKAGASQARACELAGLDVRTVQRWRARPDGDDLRHGPHSVPANKLTAEEEATIIELVTSPEFLSLSPHQLVAKLADMSIYVASEATIYRLLRRRRLLTHRDRARPRKHHRPREHVATGPNQVWAWDITYLPAAVRGAFWYLLIDDNYFCRSATITSAGHRARPEGSSDPRIQMGFRWSPTSRSGC